MDLPILDNYGPRGCFDSARSGNGIDCEIDAAGSFAQHLNSSKQRSDTAPASDATGDRREPEDAIDRNDSRTAEAQPLSPPPQTDSPPAEELEAAGESADTDDESHNVPSPEPAAGATPDNEGDGTQQSAVAATTSQGDSSHEKAKGTESKSQTAPSPNPSQSASLAAGQAATRSAAQTPNAAANHPDSGERNETTVPIESPEVAIPLLQEETADSRSTKTNQQAGKHAGRVERQRAAAANRSTETVKPDGGKLNPDPSTAGDSALVVAGQIPELPLPAGAMGEDGQAPEGGDLKPLVDAPHRLPSQTERLPDQLAARGIARPETSSEVSQMDQTRLIQRVVRAIEVAPQRGGMIRLRLSPPELGSLNMEINIRQGVLSARLETETQLARTVLLDNLPQLRDRLEQQGLRIEAFEVNVSQRDAQDPQQQSRGFRESQSPSSAERGGNDSDGATPDGEDPIRARRFIYQGKLNVVI